jgi:hypothetical protein
MNIYLVELRYKLNDAQESIVKSLEILSKEYTKM